MQSSFQYIYPDGHLIVTYYSWVSFLSKQMSDVSTSQIFTTYSPCWVWLVKKTEYEVCRSFNLDSYWQHRHDSTWKWCCLQNKHSLLLLLFSKLSMIVCVRSLVSRLSANSLFFKYRNANGTELFPSKTKEKKLLSNRSLMFELRSWLKRRKRLFFLCFFFFIAMQLHS